MSRPNVPLFDLRGLIEFDERYKVFAGYCLETGSVVTASDVELAKDMLKELLEDEISFAIKHNNLRNLLASPAPLEVWKRWQALAKLRKPEIVVLNPTAQEIRLDDEPEAAVSFATAA